MDAWRVLFAEQAKRDFSRLDRPIRAHVLDRIDWLAKNLDRTALMPLHDELKGLFKLRVGDWRVMYTFEAAGRIIRVREIKHRSKAYRKRR